MLSTNGSISDENVSARRIPTDYKATREISQCKYLSQESIHVIYFLKCSLGFVHVHRCKRYRTSPNLQPPSMTGIHMYVNACKLFTSLLLECLLWLVNYGSSSGLLHYGGAASVGTLCGAGLTTTTILYSDWISCWVYVFVLLHLVESYCVPGF